MNDLIHDHQLDHQGKQSKNIDIVHPENKLKQKFSNMLTAVMYSSSAMEILKRPIHNSSTMNVKYQKS